MSAIEIINDDYTAGFDRREYHAAFFDPPYHMPEMTRRFGKTGAAPAKFGTDGAFSRKSDKWIGQQWDEGTMMFEADTWKVLSRRMLPGALMVCYTFPKNYHLVAMAAAHADLIIRAPLMWAQAQSQPSVTRIKRKGWENHSYNSLSLKPHFDLLLVAQKQSPYTPLETLERYGTGCWNINPIMHADGRHRHPASIVMSEEVGSYPHTGERFYHADYLDGEWLYAPKPSQAERGVGVEENIHPSIKPILFNRWVASLLLPPYHVNARLFNPFAGSGSEAIGAMLAGWKDIVSVEKDKKYADIAESRLKWWLSKRNQYDTSDPREILIRFKQEDLKSAIG